MVIRHGSRNVYTIESIKFNIKITEILPYKKVTIPAVRPEGFVLQIVSKDLSGG
jgi:hypothetical protein